MNKVTIPPGKYFISHSYKDADMCDKMIKELPEGIEPFIFPRINVAPYEFVSNALIEGILACDGVIYLSGGYSDKSFWVAFEREYALRAGKPLWAYYIEDCNFKQYVNTPLDLNLIYLYDEDNYQRVNFIRDYMIKERFFSDIVTDFNKLVTPIALNFWGKNSPHPLISGEQSIEFYLEQMRQGFLAIIFWPYTMKLSTPRGSIDDIVAIPHPILSIIQKNNLSDQLLFASLNDSELPKSFKDHPEALRVQLWEDGELTHVNRIDDLIVRLYWLIFRNQFPDLLHD